MTPLVLLTGFLGSGKTTLLNKIIKAREGDTRRFAVVVNEFGDVGIDGDLLPSDVTSQVELPGGCICCQLDEDLEKTLMGLVGEGDAFAAIFVETTGVAEPLPISWTLAKEPLASKVRLAAIVTVVDGQNHLAHRKLGPGVDNQTEYADILAVTKLTDGKLDAELSHHLDEINPRATRLLDDGQDLGSRLWDIVRDPGFQPSERPPASPGGHSHNVFESVSLPIEGVLDMEELEEQLQALPGSYTRIKGVAEVVDGSTGDETPHYVVFHRVGTRVSKEPIAGQPGGRIVAIGTQLDRRELAACLTAAMIRSS